MTEIAVEDKLLRMINTLTKNRTLQWLWPIGWAAAIHVLSAMPADETMDTGIPHIDKVMHAVAYGMLAWLFYRAAAAQGRRKAVVIALAVTLGFGAFEEYHQSRIPSRHADIVDWLADAMGAVAACTIATRRKQGNP